MSATIPPPGAPGDPLSATLAQWRAAEERLYPVVMTRPDLYERSVKLVRQVADELMGCREVDALVQAWDDAAGIVHRAASMALMPLDELDAGLVAGAGFALRYRELAVEAARAARLARIEEVAARGGGWVEVERVGSAETMGMLPHSWVEMHVPSGVALRQAIEADLSTGTARFLFAVVRRDPATGDPIEEEPEVAAEETFEDRQEWVAAVEARRREIEGSGTGSDT